MGEKRKGEKRRTGESIDPDYSSLIIDAEVRRDQTFEEFFIRL